MMKPGAEQPKQQLLCAVRLEEPVAEKLANRLKADGRAHALFDLWRNLVGQPNALSFAVKPARESKSAFHCCLECGQAFTHADLVFRHYRQRHGEKAVKFIQQTVEPPKGNFTFVARCGLCRAPICPPNYHAFTARLVAHHKDRHDRIPFEDFRAKVSNSSNPEDVEAWKKAASVVEECHCAHCGELLPDEHLAAEHLKAAHRDQIVKTSGELIVHGTQVKQLDCRDVRRVCAEMWDKERKEPGHFLALLRQALNKHGLQLFRDILGHQFACRYRPRRPAPGDRLTPRQQEMIAMAGAPARRGHKPNRHTFRDHFTAQGASEEEVKADVDALVKQGLLVEFDNGQLDALGPGSHIASRE
jgi:hypothetical protein